MSIQAHTDGQIRALVLTAAFEDGKMIFDPAFDSKKKKIFGQILLKVYISAIYTGFPTPS